MISFVYAPAITNWGLDSQGRLQDEESPFKCNNYGGTGRALRVHRICQEKRDLFMLSVRPSCLGAALSADAAVLSNLTVRASKGQVFITFSEPTGSTVTYQACRSRW